MALFTDAQISNLRVIGPAGNAVVVGCHTIRMGDPSTIATHFGIPNISASLVDQATGRIHLRGPKAPTGSLAPRSVRIFAQHNKPTAGSGAFLAGIYNVQPGSGTYEVHADYPTATTLLNVGGAFPSGAIIDTFWFVTPVTTF